MGDNAGARGAVNRTFASDAGKVRAVYVRTQDTNTWIYSRSHCIWACFKFCEGYDYFGTEYGTECYCGNSELSTRSTNFRMPCSGDATETCGGRDAISVYQRNGPGVPAPMPPSPSPKLTMDDGYCEEPYHCYEDYGYDRVLDGKFTRSKEMSWRYCEYRLKFCEGYKYYGTEHGDGHITIIRHC